MGLSPHLTSATRREIIGAKKNRVPLKEIAANMHIKESTVQYTWKMRNKREPHDQHDITHGRPRKTIVEQDQDLYRRTRLDPWLTLRHLMTISPLSSRSIKRRMNEFDDDYRKHRAPYRPSLLSQHTGKRKRFANINLKEEDEH